MRLSGQVTERNKAMLRMTQKKLKEDNGPLNTQQHEAKRIAPVLQPHRFLVQAGRHEVVKLWRRQYPNWNDVSFNRALRKRSRCMAKSGAKEMYESLDRYHRGGS